MEKMQKNAIYIGVIAIVFMIVVFVCFLFWVSSIASELKTHMADYNEKSVISIEQSDGESKDFSIKEVAQASWAWTNEKEALLKVMKKYPGAGIELSDTLEEANEKFLIYTTGVEEEESTEDTQ